MEQQEQIRYVGPGWAAEAMRLWLEGERSQALADMFGVTPQRMHQIVQRNVQQHGLERPWKPLSGFTDYVCRTTVGDWADKGYIRRLDSGLVHEDDVLERISMLMDRPCHNPRCENPVDHLKEDVVFCSDCRVKRDEYPESVMTAEERKANVDRRRRWRHRRKREGV